MKHILPLLALALLTACSQAPLADPLPPLSFNQTAPFQIAAAQVRVDQNYQPPLTRPNVEQEFAMNPAQAVGIWARDRLQANGSGGLLIVNIDDASVREVLPPRTTGIRGLFTTDNGEYTGKLSVNFRLYDGVNPIAVAEATVNVTRLRTLNRDAAPAERDQFYDTLMRDLIRDFDTQATIQLRQYFAAYLR